MNTRRTAIPFFTRISCTTTVNCLQKSDPFNRSSVRRAVHVPTRLHLDLASGYRGQSSFVQTLNDPFYYENAGFIGMCTSVDVRDAYRMFSVDARAQESYYVGGRLLTSCEVSFLEETRMNTLNPAENLNDEM